MVTGCRPSRFSGLPVHTGRKLYRGSHVSQAAINTGVATMVGIIWFVIGVIALANVDATGEDFPPTMNSELGGFDAKTVNELCAEGFSSGTYCDGIKNPMLAHELEMKAVFGAKMGSRSSTQLPAQVYPVLKIETKIRADKLVCQHRKQAASPIAVKVHDAARRDGHSQANLSSKKPQKMNATLTHYYGSHTYYHDHSVDYRSRYDTERHRDSGHSGQGHEDSKNAGDEDRHGHTGNIA